MANLKKLYPFGFNASVIYQRETGDHFAAFENALKSVGLIVDNIDQTGNLVRVKTAEDKGRKRTGWYVFYHGNEFSAGAFGDWRSGEQNTWSSHSVDELDPEQRLRHQRQMEEIRATREREQAAQHEAAKKTATTKWMTLDHPEPSNPYLVRKQITAIGIRREGNRLVVPIMDDSGQIQSLQFISHDGQKRFLTGGKLKGGRITLGNDSHTIYICEGYSTGVTIHQATGDQVICAFNSGNLMTVAESVREKNITARIVIAGDNDQFLPAHIGNVGANKAREVATKINAEVKLPEFSNVDEQPTDFNDLACLEGVDSVKSQLGFIANLSFPLSDIATRETKEIEWLLDGVLSVGAPSILFAAGGAGKGYFIQQLAACVATGTDFFDLKVKKGPVLSIYCEDDIDELHRRQKAICDVHNIDYKELDNVNMVTRIAEPNSFLITFDNKNIGTPTEFYHRLEAEIQRVRPALVTFDTSGDAFPGSENDKAQVNQLLKGVIGALATKYNCTILLTGHTPKNGQEFAGHMAWENSVRHRIFIDHNRDTGVRRVYLSKSNRAKEGELFNLQWRDGCLVKMIDAGFIEKEKVKTIERDICLLIDMLYSRKVNINMSNGRSYAPKHLNMIGVKKKIKWSVEHYESAIETMLDSGKILLIDGHGRSSTQTLKVIENEKN